MGLQCKPGTKLAGASVASINVGECYDVQCYDQTLLGAATKTMDDAFNLFSKGYQNTQKIEDLGKCLLKNLENIKSEAGAGWEGFEGSMKQMFTSTSGFVEVSSNAYNTILAPIAKEIFKDTETLIQMFGDTLATTTNVLQGTSVSKPNATAVTSGFVNMSTIILESSTAIADNALKTSGKILTSLSKVKGLSALSCIADDVVDPTIDILTDNVQELVVDAVTMFANLMNSIGESSVIVTLMDWAVDLSKDAINLIMQADATVAKIDQFLGWGAAKGCNAVMTFLTDMIQHDDVKPVGLDCEPGVTLESKPANMVTPVIEAALIGLTQVFFEQVHRWLYAPLVAQLVTLTRTVVTEIENGIHALCGIAPVAGSICAAVIAVIDTALGVTVPAMVQDLLNGIYNFVEDFFTHTVPTWANDIYTWYLKSTKLGKEQAALTLTVEDDINGFVAPVAKIFVPIAQDLFELFMPKLGASLTTCANQYNGVYVALQNKWCDAKTKYTATPLKMPTAAPPPGPQ